MRRSGLLLPSWQGAFEKTIIYLLASSVLISAVYADVSWTGGVSQVGPVVFGGPPYCTYQVTLGNVEMVLTLDQSAYTSSVQGLSIEEGLNGCPLGTTPPNLHHYSATAANVTRLGDQFHIVYTP